MNHFAARARLGIGFAAALLMLSPSAAAGTPDGLDWDVRAARHLINRAGFGARLRDVERAVEMGAEAFVRSLLAGPEYPPEPFFADRFSPRDVRMGKGEGEMSYAMERRAAAAKQDMRAADREQMESFRAFWLQRMVRGEDPLRERMTLFWHGHFPSSYRDVRSSYELIRQNEFLRANALGHFSDLLHGIARDPAMLEYLDNDANKKRHPNENFAREVMELFSLGEGNYTEQDIKEAARAFTGWTDLDGEFHFVARRHDFGEKTVLGRTGDFDGDDVIDILLEQEACARFMASKLIAYFEGTAPDGERLERYAAFLREQAYSIAAFLGRLFLDAEFYRDEVVGTRIASPVDYLIGSARRLGVRPPGRTIAHAAELLNEKLFEPPNVKGWEGGEAWITTSSMLSRSNLVGTLLGLVDTRASVMRRKLFARTEPGEMTDMDGMQEAGDMEESMESAEMGEAMADEKTGLENRNLRLMTHMGGPFLNLKYRVESAGVAGDVEIADFLLGELLAVNPSRELRAETIAYLAAEREALGQDDGSLLDAGRKVEPVLRRAAHLILSLPDGHLH